MAEILNNHRLDGAESPINNGINYQPQLVNAGFQGPIDHQQYHLLTLSWPFGAFHLEDFQVGVCKAALEVLQSSRMATRHVLKL